MTEDTKLDLQDELMELGQASLETEGTPIGEVEDQGNFLG